MWHNWKGVPPNRKCQADMGPLPTTIERHTNQNIDMPIVEHPDHTNYTRDKWCTHQDELALTPSILPPLVERILI
jgi:hypothetical protein